jgi:hypothetical protein
VAAATIGVEETRGRTRADIVVEGPSWTVVIEAKVDALEQDRQGARLSELWPGATYVFLTRTGGPMNSAGDEPWITIRWRDLLTAIRRAFAGTDLPDGRSPGAARARRAFDDYLTACTALER